MILCTISATVLAQTRIDSSDIKYKRCNDLIRKTPEYALEHAGQWLRQEQSATAMHCRSIALYALKRYSESADELMKIHQMAASHEVTLRASLKRQAARAWMLDGKTDKALASLNDAISRLAFDDSNNLHIRRVSVELLMERADIYIRQGEFLTAIQDLDHAITFNILRHQVLLKRAETYIKIGNTDLAKKDLYEITLKNPDHHKAKELLDMVRD